MCFKKKITITEPIVNPLKSAGKIEAGKMNAIIQSKIDEMNDEASIFMPDMKMKIYNKEEIKKWLNLDETDKIVFVEEEHDCDDFAAELFGKGVPVIWSTKHALNWFVDTMDTLWFIEPQTDKISQTLEDWQGWDIRFFLGR